MLEEELNAAKERTMQPLEERIKQFKGMLREKDVSLILCNKVVLNLYPVV